jgi:TetR/AcrR family transcriptional regulator
MKAPSNRVAKKRRAIPRTKRELVVSRAKLATRRQKASEARTEQLLNAALEVFASYGFHGSSLEQIAEKADISKTNLLYYFSSKKALYDAVMTRIIDIWLEPLKAFEKTSDPIVAFDGYIRAKLEYSRDYPLASKLFCLAVVSGDDGFAELVRNSLSFDLRELVDAKVRVIRGWMDEGCLAEIEPYHLLFSIWSITQHYADFAAQVEVLTGRTLADPEFFDETVANVRSLLFNGLLLRSEEQSPL